MQELVFINKNINRWKKFEALSIKDISYPPDQLAAMFIQITDDLSYCRTFFPNSDTERYLNALAAKTHYNIYKNKKESRSKFFNFWKFNFPLIIYDIRKYIFISIALFLFSALIGAFSAANDNNFVRTILGDAYVDMTMDNIDKGDPMAVYKKMMQTDMFLAITFNNIKVAFLAFVWGLLLIVGTVYIMMSNGVMLGSFQYFFYEQGIFLESVLTIWIHGTLEIFAIIISGAAGLLIGVSVLLPGTYTRLESFKQATVKGVKIMIGIVPIFIVAGFLEGFVTRYTDAPVLIRASIILGSLVFIVWYFFLYPAKLAKTVVLNKKPSISKS
ncbi:MAG: stage II sporulation protein M [Bacteroidetes bacterium]|nr:MAG: stage II sporulation protein M [Bacteroidota bacterium]